ncbi:MAG: DNA (cytosine-5-)-methyltransferase [Defluviitaleaceae bacterium]|nr:DNA (cytosine-5-)-methyltransferase [Defluviitaleaceae bacterium]
MTLKFIDLFAGIGGIRLGFEQSGMECVFSSEWDRFAAQTYQANFGEIPHGDITQISAGDIPDHHILAGGFPCQPFSTIGKRQGFGHETQGNLFFEILRILEGKKPNAFLLENVPGIRTIEGGRVFESILEELGNIGYYTTTLDLNAVDYGVPQNRKRVYFVGVYKKYGKAFDYIKPKPVQQSIGRHIEKNAQGYDMSEHIVNKYLFKKDDGRPEIVDETTDTPVKTLVSTYHKIQRLTGTFVKDGDKIRLLTEGECKAIMGFPQSFIIPVSRTQMYRQMGNSVAVPVIADIACQLKEFLVTGGKNNSRDFDEGDLAWKQLKLLSLA